MIEDINVHTVVRVKKSSEAGNVNKEIYYARMMNIISRLNRNPFFLLPVA